jgi:hypothetical protein
MTVAPTTGFLPLFTLPWTSPVTSPAATARGPGSADVAELVLVCERLLLERPEEDKSLGRESAGHECSKKKKHEMMKKNRREILGFILVRLNFWITGKIYARTRETVSLLLID